MVECDDEIKVFEEINVELESGTNKLIEKRSQEKDSQEEALEEFNSTLDNVLEKLSHEKDTAYDFYGFMYDTDDGASISGKSSDHFGWDWPEKDSPCTKVAGEVIFYPPVHEEVAEEVMEIANDQAEALSDQEVADDCLNDKHALKNEDPGRGTRSPKRRCQVMNIQRKATII
ncbi:hypothetical protein Tco_0999306 [Tanacetum coccineum]